MEIQIGLKVFEELKCPVCWNIAQDPVESSCCHHIFCSNCSSQLDRFCAVCRQPTIYTPSVFARRITENVPCKCIHCQKDFTRGTVKEHEVLCGYVDCPAPNCHFKVLVSVLSYTGCKFLLYLLQDIKEKFLSHLFENHKDIVLKNYNRLFSIQPQAVFEDPVITKQNASGRTARLGSSSKYYCGGSLNQRCVCCNGYCGPTNGCNCVDCMKLDVDSRRLPKGYLVNKEGAVARQGSTGIFYCGRKVMQPSNLCDGYCGPTNGPNCSSCIILDSFKSNRYASLL